MRVHVRNTWIVLGCAQGQDAAVRGDQDVHLIMDNYATHKTDKVKAWLAAHPRYQVHLTSTSASRLNLVERFFSTLSEKWIKRQAHTSVKSLEESIEYYRSTHNANPRPFRWYRKADDILASVGRAAEAARPINMSVTFETPH